MHLRHTLTAVVLTIASMPAVARAQSSALEKLQIHGYFTQGFAQSSDLPMAGVPTSASADLRVAALLARYALTSKDQVTVQVRHRHFGSSAVTDAEGDLTLNWAFYEHKFGPLAAKVGRLPMPRGIYNEFRDVGTLIPFVRAPYRSYSEGFETIDGIALRHRMGLGGGWEVESDGYYGKWKNALGRYNPDNSSYIRKQVHENMIGGQIWLQTPVQGLRVGSVGAVFDRVEQEDGEKILEPNNFVGASLDASFTRTMLRAEYRRDYEKAEEDTDFYVYAQAGVGVTSKVWLYAQTERRDQRELDDDEYEVENDYLDHAAAVNYRALPNLVFKVELHRASGRSFDGYVAPGSRGRTTYGILSTSYSF
ncbi:MAG: hypothetical protein ACXWZS_04410 [Gemmatirosa sp.]